ncbi:MAG: YgiQ family radical SAM protein [Clostridia bacterium]
MFLPICKEDLKERNIDSLDFILVTGEAYVDHPSFGHAIVSRLFEAEGFTVGIIAQPMKKEDYMKLGKPNIAFLVSSGVIDSMVNNYTVAKKKRKDDVYSPGGVGGKRPDRATIVYTQALKNIYKDSFVIIGSVEASLRRFAHYDYWADKVMPSILEDSNADLLMYGMGERPIWDLCALLKKNVPIEKIKDVRGTCYLADEAPALNEDTILIPSFDEVSSSKEVYAKTFLSQYEEQDDVYGKRIVQKQRNKFLVQNKPQRILSKEEMDKTYSLPYMRTYHPIYENQGKVPSITEVKFSLTSVRGCFGSCNYCALTFHQGRKVQARSHENIIEEAKILTKMEDFKGYIHDVGGPTANFRHLACKKQAEYGACKNKLCLTPAPCKNLEVDHSDYLNLLRKLRSLDNVKKVFVRSGIRFDYLMKDPDDTFFKELCKYHISGQLKVAPEHCSERVLEKMGKPTFAVYKSFVEKYKKINNDLGKDQYIVPYFISSHPGATLADAIKLAEYLKEINHMPEQVQDFYPTPATFSTTMYYTGLDPRTMQKVYVPKTFEEKRMQRALLQYRRKENYEIVKSALIKAGRLDLIGFEPNCLIKPLKEEVGKFKAMKAKQEQEKKMNRPKGTKVGSIARQRMKMKKKQAKKK